MTASAGDCKGFNIYYLQKTAASTEQMFPAQPGPPGQIEMYVQRDRVHSKKQDKSEFFR